MNSDATTPTVVVVAAGESRDRLRAWLPDWGFTACPPAGSSPGEDLWRAKDVRVALTEAIPAAGAAPAYRLVAVGGTGSTEGPGAPEGADDLLPVPLDPLVARARILSACRLVRLEAELSAARRAAAARDADRRAADERTRLLEAAFEAAGEGLMITDADYRIEHINPAVTAQTGYALDEVRGLTPRVFQGPLTEGEEIDRIRRALAEGRRLTGELTNYRKDGRAQRIALTICPVRGADGGVSHYVGVRRDVTAEHEAERERRRLAARIAKAKREWEATVDAVGAPIALLDGRRRVVRCNRGLARLAGRGLDECLGARWDEVFPGLPLPAPGEETLEWTHPPTGRSFLLMRRACEVGGEEPAAATVVAMLDISERRRVEMNVMARVDRWATLGALALATAHEINNPLATVRLQVQNLETLLFPGRGDADSPDAAGLPVPSDRGALIREGLAVLRSASDRIGAVVEEMRRFGRPQDAPAEEIDVGELVESALALLRPKLKGIEVTTRLAPDLPRIRANRIKLEQVLINLCANAADAMAQGGGRSELTVSAFADPEGVTVEVADTGPGIPGEVAEKIFKTYVSTKPAERGTGLGLMITRANVHALGGAISFRTQPGEGTVFTVRVPASGTPPQENGHDRLDSHH